VIGERGEHATAGGARVADASAGPALDARRVAAAALASLPGIDDLRLRTLLERFEQPEVALDAVRSGRVGRQTGVHAGRWREHAAPRAVAALECRLRERATHVWVRGDPDYPIAELPFDGPAVLLGEGDPRALAQPMVAIVGTRSASPHGLADAHRLGEYLARAGCTVVSGMALGIDGAAHDGALAGDGRAVGIVATGLDVEYPRRHRSLYRRVRASGMVLTEHGFGVLPEPFRFPQRNRIIAAIARVVVVVEATLTGGARITAELAGGYGREVFALPGSRRNRAAAGCATLLRDGAHVLVDPADVLLQVGITAVPRGWDAAPPAPLPATARRLLAALAGEPATVDQAAGRCGLGLGEVAEAVRALERAGRLVRRRGLLWPT
jgi:DNA processing protein